MSTNLPPAGEPEYLGSGPAEEPARARGARPGRRAVGLTAVAAGVVAAVGLGGWGVLQLMAGGTSPATAVPANAVGYVSVDLDPSAGQKIEALKILKKFPAIAEELDLDVRDDVRRWVFEQMQDDIDCTGFDYEDDVAPWIGDRLAVAAVPGGKKSVLPLVALQVSDQDAAGAAVDELEACEGGKHPAGVAFVGDYMLLSEKQADVDAMAASAEQASLEDDADFRGWMDRVGDPGIVTAYASADAPRVLADEMKGDMPLDPADLAQGFKGMAGVIRFEDGAVEAEVVSGGLPDAASFAADGAGSDLATLPDTTAAAFSVGFPDGWLDEYLDSVQPMLPQGQSLDDLWAQGEAQTGLRLPEDLETLLGQGISVSVDSDIDLGRLGRSGSPSDIPVGVRIRGDQDEISAVLDRLRAALGPVGQQLVVETGDGTVALGLDKAYVHSLLEDGGLGDVDSFRSVVPESDRAGGAFFVNFDAGDGWLDKIGKQLGDAEVARNLAPLDAAGSSSWVDGDDNAHVLFKLTTD